MSEVNLTQRRNAIDQYKLIAWLKGFVCGVILVSLLVIWALVQALPW